METLNKSVALMIADETTLDEQPWTIINTRTTPASFESIFNVSLLACGEKSDFVVFAETLHAHHRSLL